MVGVVENKRLSLQASGSGDRDDELVMVDPQSSISQFTSP